MAAKQTTKKSSAPEGILSAIYELDAQSIELQEEMEALITPLRERLQALTDERNALFSQAVASGVKEETGYKMEIITVLGKKSRSPRVADAIAAMKKKFGAKAGVEKAFEVATFQIKGLQKVFTEEEIDAISDIKQSVSEERRVVKV